MVFSSHIFLFYFLPLALAVYYLLPRRAKHLGLTALSYGFYGWSNPLFVLILLTSTVVDYFCGLIIAQRGLFSDNRPMRELKPGGDRTRRQKAALAVSITTNLALLGFFKYFNFAVENYDLLLTWLGLEGLRLDTALRITLPLGISFYTFQSMSYSIDVYRGQAKALRNFIDFACYVSMFPQLVAGPIIRFREVSSQLLQRSHTLEKFSRGVAFVSLGLTKKILLANPCGKVADMVFDAGSITTLQAWHGAAAYAFQIYFDFSAYSDMAIGLGLMLGFVFPKNFDSPYLARSMTDFWRRWHISLSTWLRDYLYIPLGGNRKGPGRTAINLALVMLLGGLWHGAAWTFIIWGGLHGLLLGLERIRGKTSPYHRLPVPVQVALTFVLVLFTWVFFRAEDLPSALTYVGTMLGLGQTLAGAGLLDGLIYQPYYLGTFLLAAAVTWACPQTWDWTRRITLTKCMIILLLLVLAVAVLATQAFNPFIYFIF
ncbi:MAG TPA: MBOAT family protein [Desulfonatronum sp.]|nr:MBOAT family protein [Desulfonatronum sp.]